MRTDHVVALIGRVRERANRLICAELLRLGHPELAPSHGSILAALYDQGDLPMSVLAKAIGKKKNTLTVLVKKLEKAGYVRRELSLTDSRVSIITLTEKGKAFRKDFNAVSEKLLATVWGDMEKSQREALVAGLERLSRNLG